MNISQIIIFSVAFCVFIYAFYCEKYDQKNAYLLGKANIKDSLSLSIHKLDICFSYDLKTVKWRLSFIATNLIIILIFALIRKELPTAQEYLLYLVFIFISIIIMQESYINRTSKEAVIFSRENIKNIKKTLLKTRSFILPW